MAFKLPDKGAGQNDIQSILFREYLEILVDGVVGKNCVLAGCAVTAQGSPNMTVAVANGAVLSNGVLKAVTAGNVTISTADGTNPRIDLIVVDSAGAKQCRAGTAAAAPKPPVRTANDVVIAAVFVPAADTTIGADQITDMRMMREQGPIVIFRSTTVESTDSTGGAIHILNKTGNGLPIPDDLFLAGRMIRVKIGGTMVVGNGSPTITLSISFNGTTIFSDVTGATTADTDHIAWFLEFTINAQANNDQGVAGFFMTSILGSKTAPANGQGDIAGTAALVNPISGSAAVDSTSGDKTLAATININTSSVNNICHVEFATAELI